MHETHHRICVVMRWFLVTLIELAASMKFDFCPCLFHLLTLTYQVTVNTLNMGRGEMYADNLFCARMWQRWIMDAAIDLQRLCDGLPCLL